MWRIVFHALVALAPLTSLAGVYDELTAEQQRAVQNGEQVFLTEEVPGATWPKVTIYQRIEAAPEESAAVFADYELQSSYVPKLKKSKIRSRVDKTTTLVDYVLDLPWPLSDENYTLQNKVSRYDGVASFRVDWSLVRADTTRASVGSVQFERLGGVAIVRYYSFIAPCPVRGPWITDYALSQMRSAAAAIVEQVETEKRVDPARLDRQLDALRGALE